MSPELRGRRVAVVNWRDLGHSLAGGSEHYAWHCALALRDAGADVDFLTARESGQAAREVADRITIRRAGRRYGFYPRTLARLLWNRVRRRGYDVVIDPENGIPVFAPLVLSRRTVVVLVMHHVHQEQFRTYFSRPMSDLGRWLERRLMPWAYRDAAIVVVSDSTRREMAAQLHWTPRTVLIPNGTPPTQVEAPATISPRVLVLGRLAEHKRVDAVIRAFAMVARTRPDLGLDIVGRGPVADSLAQEIDRLGLADRVTLHGFLPEEEKQALLRDSLLHVCASDAEGWGQVVVEAASYGVPTLARDVPGLRDSVRDGVTGWLLPDPSEGGGLDQRLGVRLGELVDELSDRDVRRRIGEECRAWAREFTWPAHHRAVEELVAAEVSRRLL